MNRGGWFVTGTDTGIGKTVVAQTLLTALSWQFNRIGIRRAGWVANQVEPGFTLFEENVATLKIRLDAPLRGYISLSEIGL